MANPISPIVPYNNLSLPSTPLFAQFAITQVINLTIQMPPLAPPTEQEDSNLSIFLMVLGALLIVVLAYWYGKFVEKRRATRERKAKEDLAKAEPPKPDTKTLAEHFFHQPTAPLPIFSPEFPEKLIRKRSEDSGRSTSEMDHRGSRLNQSMQSDNGSEVAPMPAHSIAHSRVNSVFCEDKKSSTSSSPHLLPQVPDLKSKSPEFAPDLAPQKNLEKDGFDDQFALEADRVPALKHVDRFNDPQEIATMNEFLDPQTQEKTAQLTFQQHGNKVIKREVTEILTTYEVKDQDCISPPTFRSEGVCALMPYNPVTPILHNTQSECINSTSVTFKTRKDFKGQKEDRQIIFNDQAQNMAIGGAPVVAPILAPMPIRPVPIKALALPSAHHEEVKVSTTPELNIPALEEIFEDGRFHKKFDEIVRIGKGGYGKVFKARAKLERAIYAIKVIRFTWRSDNDIRSEAQFREVLTLVKLSQEDNHNNIVKYNGCWLELDHGFDVDDVASVGGGDNDSDSRPRNDTITVPHKGFDDRISLTDSKVFNTKQTDLSGLGFAWDNADEDNDNENTKKSAISKLNDSDGDICDENNSPNHGGSPQKRVFGPQPEPMKLSDVSTASTRPSHLTVLLHIQMEYCSDRTLKDYLDDPRRKLDHHQAFNFFRQIVKGVHFIHRHRVIHRDLKPANIFIVRGKYLKIGDFGLARSPVDSGSPGVLTTGEQETKLKRNASFNYSIGVGTPLYNAPEQETSMKYDQKVDMYALGLIFLEMCCIFSTVHERIHLFKKLRTTPGELPFGNDPELALQSRIIRKLVNANASCRPNAIELIKSPEYMELDAKYPISTDDEDL